MAVQYVHGAKNTPLKGKKFLVCARAPLGSRNTEAHRHLIFAELVVYASAGVRPPMSGFSTGRPRRGVDGEALDK